MPGHSSTPPPGGEGSGVGGEARAEAARSAPPPKAPAPFTRRSALHRSLRHGRHGADRPGTPGVVLAQRHPVSIVSVIARNGKAHLVSEAMASHFGLPSPPPGESRSSGGLSLHWCGFEQWYAVADGFAEGALYEALKDRLSGLASVCDQSHGRVIIHIGGPNARDVLAKGTPVDLHPRTFGPGRSAVTQMAHVGVHIAQVAPEAFELSLFRGFAESFWEWLAEMSGEFGYEVR